MGCQECEEEAKKNRTALARRGLGASNAPADDIVQQLGAIQYLLDQASAGQPVTTEMVDNAQRALTAISQDAIDIRGTALTPGPSSTPGFSTGATALIGVTAGVLGIATGMALTGGLPPVRFPRAAEETRRTGRRRRRR